MTAEQFTYWLQGFAELAGGVCPTQEQWNSIVEHLNLVFNKQTAPVQLSPRGDVTLPVDSTHPHTTTPKLDPSLGTDRAITPWWPATGPSMVC